MKCFGSVYTSLLFSSLLFSLTILSWSPLWAMSITIEDLAYRELTDEPAHLDASLHYRVVVDPDYPTDCLSYGYRVRLFTQMQGISDYDNLETYYEICKDQPPIDFKLFHKRSPVTTTGLFARDAVILEDNAHLNSIEVSESEWSPGQDCRVYANSLISLEDNVLLEGSLNAPEIDLSGTASYTGSLNEADQPLPWFETEVDQAFALAQQINDNDKTGGINQLFDETDNGYIELEEGLYAVDNLFLGGQTTIVLKGRVMIFSSGDVHIAGSARIHDGGDPLDLAIYSAGNIFCAGGTILNSQLYALSGEIFCTDNALVRGSLTAQTITM
ncbi:hypothetical protein JXQ70_03685, partial [bacterium]|nr:hypothetical protein [bacterium]